MILNTVTDAMWVQKGFSVKPDFISANKTFDATIGELDFTSQQSVDVINNWASEKTHGKIRAIAGPTTYGRNARLLLARRGLLQRQVGGSVSKSRPLMTSHFTCALASRKPFR